jgi:hypothetical protein
VFSSAVATSPANTVWKTLHGISHWMLEEKPDVAADLLLDRIAAHRSSVYYFHFAPDTTSEVFTVYTVIRSIEVGLMARIDLFAKIPLIGMSLVFLAMFIVAVTAYLHVGWYSIIGYAIAAVVAVAGFVMTFRDVRDTPGPAEQWDVRGTPIDPASPRN